jgi:hypothetical protein
VVFGSGARWNRVVPFHFWCCLVENVRSRVVPQRGIFHTLEHNASLLAAPELRLLSCHSPPISVIFLLPQPLLSLSALLIAQARALSLPAHFLTEVDVLAPNRVAVVGSERTGRRCLQSRERPALAYRRAQGLWPCRPYGS